jgi:mono/diheme cytochrome c family protein
MKLSSFLFSLFVVAACSTQKKSSTTAADQGSGPAPVNPAPVMVAKPSNGVYAPGEAELAAIKMKYSDATMSQLAEGHSLYTGVCTNCHGAKNIYRPSDSEWPHIIDDMARKAKITDSQKDAVSKYVFAIRAAQQNSGK